MKIGYKKKEETNKKLISVPVTWGIRHNGIAAYIFYLRPYEWKVFKHHDIYKCESLQP